MDAKLSFARQAGGWQTESLPSEPWEREDSGGARWEHICVKLGAMLSELSIIINTLVREDMIKHCIIGMNYLV
jgi:hypothetical protein